MAETAYLMSGWRSYLLCLWRSVGRLRTGAGSARCCQGARAARWLFYALGDPRRISSVSASRVRLRGLWVCGVRWALASREGAGLSPLNAKTKKDQQRGAASPQCAVPTQTDRSTALFSRFIGGTVTHRPKAVQGSGSLPDRGSVITRGAVRIGR